MTDHSAPNTHIADIAVGLISPNPHNPRSAATTDPNLSSLAASLAAEGLIQPVVVRPLANGYELVAGERRWRAAQLAGLPTIPAIIRDDLDDAASARLALAENCLRSDLNPIERAHAYQTLNKTHHIPQADVARLAGVSQPVVANTLRILALPEAVKAHIAEGRLSLAHAVALCRFVDYPSLAIGLAALAVEENLPAKTLDTSLPLTYPLVKARLIATLYEHDPDYDLARPRPCGSCQHRRVAEHSQHCLQPACHDVKIAACQQEQQAQVAQAARELAANLGLPEGQDQPRLADLPRESYHRLSAYDHPSDCPPPGKCKSHRIGTDYSASPTWICIDVTCWNRKIARDRRQTNKHRADTIAAWRRQTLASLKVLPDQPCRELALIAHRLDSFLSPRQSATIRKHVPSIASAHPDPAKRLTLDDWAALPTTDLIRAAALSIVELEISAARQAREPHAPLTQWYAGLLPAAAPLTHADDQDLARDDTAQEDTYQQEEPS